LRQEYIKNKYSITKMQGGPDMSQIMKMAQQVASSIEPPPELSQGNVNPTEIDMNKMIQQVTSQVSKMVTPDMISKMGGNIKEPKKTPREKAVKAIKAQQAASIPPEESKISFKVESPEKKKTNKSKMKIEEVLDSDSDCDPINPRTKDMMFTMDVTLEDLYNGKKKKLAIRRQKLDGDSATEEKKKISVTIEKGMIDEQTIRFNKLADEKQGYETGDVVIILSLQEHDVFERDGNNLIIEKEISLFESYNPCVYLTHLDGRVLKITGEKMDVLDEEFDTFKKVTGEGMPITGEPGKFGDLFIRFKCVLPQSFNKSQMDQLALLFPKINEPIENETIVHKELELVTESDLEFLDDSDSEYDSEYDSDYDSEYSTDEESEESLEKESVQDVD
jgi:hypothetical protein